MKSSDEERGAIAVIVAILMTALIGFAAIGVDVANMASDKQQLQNGADAGALAIAQGCAAGDCGDTAGLAQSMATANRNDGGTNGSITGVVTELDLAAGRVSVTSSGLTDHWFAPVLGTEASPVTADATAIFVPMSGGDATLPLAISLCEIDALSKLTGDFIFVDGQFTIAENPSQTEVPIVLSKNTTTEGCFPAPSGNWLPGGFGWLDTDGTCSAEIEADSSVSSKTGVSVPGDCTATYLEDLVGSTIAIPIFDEALVDGTGTNATYHILGWVGFHVTGFQFGGQYKVNAPCQGEERCISGWFDEMLESGADGSGDLSDLGARTVRLILP